MNQDIFLKYVKILSYFLRKFFVFLFSFKGLFIFFLIGLSLFVNLLFLFHPVKLKNGISQIHEKKSHKTLNRVEGPLIGVGLDIRVLKVKHENKIHLEFLSKQADNSYWFINSVELKGNREAYFDYWGEPSSLLVLDDDGAGRLEIVAPTFDQFFLPHINVVVYNGEKSRFELKKHLNYYPRVRNQGKIEQVPKPDQSNETLLNLKWMKELFGKHM